MSMYARLSPQGTACQETALCGTCLQDDSIKQWYRNPYGMADNNPDRPVTSYHDCTGNEALECQHCGATE